MMHKAIMCAALICTGAAHAETGVNSADYVDGGNLAYTATADGEEVSFDSGANIVWGTTFSGNAASFNPYNASSVLTVVNPLVAIPNSSLGVAQGTTVFSGGLTPDTSTSGWVWNAKFSKTGAGTAKFTGAVDFSASSTSPQFDVAEGVAQFAGSGITHKLADLYVGNTTSGAASAIFDNTSVNFLTGCHIAFESGKYGEVYSTNSTVVVASGKDMNIGNNGGCALYAMKDGSLTVGNHLLLGRTAGSTAVFTNCGGTVTIAGRLYVGADSALTEGGSGTFVLDGGSATVNGNGYLGAGASGSSTIEVLGGGSLAMCGGSTYFAYGSANSSTKSTLKIGADGTFKSTSSTPVFGWDAGNIARLEMENGSFAAPGVMFGRSGSFRGTMTGGNVEIYGGANYNFHLGYYSPGVNRFDMMGGTFTASNGNYRIIGYNNAAGAVTSVLTVARSAVFSTGGKSIYLGMGGSETATAHGEIHLSDGGTLEVLSINPVVTWGAYGTRRLTSDGGTFRVPGSGATVAPYIGAENLESYVGRRGVTFDTGNNTATVPDFASDGKSPGQIRKTGSGTLVLGKLPQTHGGVAVQQGILRLSSGATVGTAYTPESAKIEADGNTYPEEAAEALVGANYLLHRWSFNCGNLYDSVAAKKATAYGDIEPDVVGADANLITTVAKSNDGSTYLDMGSGLFGDSDGDLTIEFWAKKTQVQGDGRLVSIGRSGDDTTVFYINLNGQTVSRVNGVNGYTYDTLQLGIPDVGTMYHYSVVFKRTANGRYNTTICRRNPSGEIHGAAAHFTGAIFSPYHHADMFCLAATPASSTSYTRGLKIDEVRIWKAALSDAQLAKNAILGPDELPLLDMGDDYASIGPVDIAEDAVFDLGGNTISYGSVSGAGTVRNGTITVSDALAPSGDTMEIAAGTTVKVTGDIVFGEGDCLNVKGTLDLTEATVRYASTSPVRSTVTLATATDGGAILGPAAAADVPSGILSVTAGSITVSPKGFFLIFR